MGDLGMPNLSNIPRDRSGYGPRIVVMDVLRSVEIGYKLVSSDEVDVEKASSPYYALAEPCSITRSAMKFRSLRLRAKKNLKSSARRPFATTFEPIDRGRPEQ